MAEQWERRRISGDLDDHLQQLLYGLQVRAQLLFQDIATVQQPELTGPVGKFDSVAETTAILGTRTLSVDSSNPPVLKGGNDWNRVTLAGTSHARSLSFGRWS